MWLVDIFLSLLDPDFWGSSDFWRTLISGIIIGAIIGIPVARFIFCRKYEKKVEQLKAEIEQLEHEIKIKNEISEVGDILHYEPDHLYED